MASEHSDRQLPRRTVVLLVERPSPVLKRLLVKADYKVVETYTTDRVVAVCANNAIDAVVLDQHLFVETDGWSVAQSLKAVKSNLYVLLSTSATTLTRKLPEGIDAIVASDDHNEIVARLARLVPTHDNPVRQADDGRGKIVQSPNPVSLSEWRKGIDSPE